MSSQPPSGAVRFGRIAATVAVSDMARSLAFYTGAMGMAIAFQNGDPPGFVILTRDDGELHLTLSRTHRATERSVAHLIVSDAKAFHDHLVERGVKIVKGLRDQAYGLRDFVVADPDGNRIDIGQSLR